MKKIIFLISLFVVLFESCQSNKPACGNRHAHKQRYLKMRRTGMWM